LNQKKEKGTPYEDKQSTSSDANAQPQSVSYQGYKMKRQETQYVGQHKHHGTKYGVMSAMKCQHDDKMRRIDRMLELMEKSLD
jgi:hypothetical protein